MREAYIEFGEWEMHIDWKERKTWKTRQEMAIAYLFVIHIL